MSNMMTQDKEAIKRIEELVVSDRASTVMVCVQGVGEGGLYGEMYNCYLKDSVRFCGVGDMVLKLDDICEWVGAPQRTTEPRFLNTEMEKKYRIAVSQHPEVDRNNLVYSINEIPFQNALKAREVLVVYVKYRQNSSLQGSIRGRLTKGEIVSFRSGMELIRMMQMIEIH
ncbi:MAG: hypothetical protein LUK37_13765 [Clostridia bacterium]|nr:hypothetical protein [Clostridia bacterium]